MVKVVNGAGISQAATSVRKDIAEITFDGNGGEVGNWRGAEPLETGPGYYEVFGDVSVGSKLLTLPDPGTYNVPGYRFKGWFDENGIEATPDTVVSQSTVYCAQWEPCVPEPEFNIVTFNANGGNVSPTTREVESGALVGTLPKPVLTGYVFLGWYTAANDGVPVDATTKVTSSVTYYAHWYKPIPGTLTMTVEPVNGGGLMKVTVKRTGGSEGRIAVKLKTQDSATVSGINGVSGRDFQYLKEYLVWEDGDMSDKVVYIQTYATDATSATTLRLKLSAQTTGDYADCVTPTLADGGKVIATITPANKGTIAIVEPDPLEVIAGELLRVKVRRTGGSDGRVAVKLKTQDSATVDGINGVSGRDFQYVKEYLVWENGDVSDRIVEIPTYAAWWDGEPRTFRLKLSVQTAGDFAGCGTPELASGGKMIASIVPNDAAYPGAVVVKSVETDYSYSYEPPWWGYAGDTLRVTVSRVGGSFGRVVVKAKTQGYPGVSDLSAVLNEDLTYVKEYFEWKDGETEDRVVEIPTALVDGTDYPLTFRLKFTAQTTGDYEDCVEPELPEPKNVIELRRE